MVKASLATILVVAEVILLQPRSGTAAAPPDGPPTGTNGEVLVADDGSLILVRSAVSQGAVADLRPDGSLRWQVPLPGRTVAAVATQGDLVVVVSAPIDRAGRRTRRDRWSHAHGTPISATGEAVAGLDLETGSELWHAALAGRLAAAPRFSSDGTALYLRIEPDPTGRRARELGGADDRFDSTSVVAIDRSGNTLWTSELPDAAVAPTPRNGQPPR